MKFNRSCDKCKWSFIKNNLDNTYHSHEFSEIIKLKFTHEIEKLRFTHVIDKEKVGNVPFKYHVKTSVKKYTYIEMQCNTHIFMFFMKNIIHDVKT
jgi:hypothetical protein